LPARWLNRTANWTAFSLLVFTLMLHSWAIYERICISGRPPVTNLYSSAVFIGWGAVVLALVLELFTRLGIGNLVASIKGFAALLIAHFLSADGDTFVVLQAVLDTQFWLATHVVCITLGYATTYLAGLLGIIYGIANFISLFVQPAGTPRQPGDIDFRKNVLKVIGTMMYGMLCIATLCSFFGTVLGGLWADDSWGRFWGWDPKENGALIIVLWNLLVLHARWDGMVKDAGTAVLAVLGNIVVSWSWFGVNELGVGLHSYGFTEGVLRALAIFAGSQLLIAACGAGVAGVQWLNARQRVKA
jgi:ABC-type transport system involved in cytochrome c biogenesis permease subunit